MAHFLKSIQKNYGQTIMAKQYTYNEHNNNTRCTDVKTHKLTETITDEALMHSRQICIMYFEDTCLGEWGSRNKFCR